MKQLLARLLAGIVVATASLSAWSAPTEVRIPAPLFSLPAIANADGIIDLESLRGNVVYVDFWASWCGPCRLSLPALNAMWQDIERDDFSVIAISIDVVEEDALDFLAEYPVDYPVLIDTDSAVPTDYAVNGMPSGYLIDRSGMVREVHVGFRSGDEAAIRESVEKLLTE